ncbi:unnamed protein product [Nezara viridula]|uniref:Uncharacterized protein n=1 Tax=Nezara viridula TaxID=85310 RepID=A0A9P0MQ13_NEZVI|nr:unnamed protein product [Nezara viridula]
MENVICTVVQEKTAEEFISVLNKYGVCIDYSNDYERSKAIQGIFVGVINKVYDVIWKGEGGHSEHDTLFMSVKSLISSRRESQPFRVGFVGKIVSQLVEINLKEGDAIGILKPKFFYALDIPTLCAGLENVVTWIAKDLKNSEVIEDVAKSSDENEYFQSLKKQNNGSDNKRKRIPFLDEDSETHSIGNSSTSGTLGHDIQMFRSRPVELKKPPEVSKNNKLVPDSTTRTLVRKYQNNRCIEKENPPENILAENLVSQNTANVGSAVDISCRNEIQSNLICNLDSAVKSVHNDLCRSCHNVGNNTCGMHSHATSYKTKCCSSRVNFCNCHTIPANHFKENSCSCNCRSSCACFNNQHCSCIRNSCCGHNAVPQCMHWNSSHSCHTDNSSCNRHVDQHCRPMNSCCRPCHSQINQCCSLPCQNGCVKSKCFHKQTNLDKACASCCNKPIAAPIHYHNSCCCNREKIKTSANIRTSNCCASRNESNSKHPKPDDSNEEMSIELSEDSHKISRTKEWIHNLVKDPPHLLPDIEHSENLGTSTQNPSLESRESILEAGGISSKQGQSHLVSSNPIDCVTKQVPLKHVVKKKKLFCPLDMSSVISAKSVYCNSTIIEESTPFDSDNHTGTPQDTGLSSDKNQDKNITKNINLSQSNNIGLDVILTDPSSVNEANNSKECVGEKLYPETNTQESLITNQLQNKETYGENRNSSEEQFPELRIETPIISQTYVESQIEGNRKDISNKINQNESDMADHDGVSCLKDNVNFNQQSKEPADREEVNSHIGESNKESSFKKVSNLHEIECDGRNDTSKTENFKVSDLHEIDCDGKSGTSKNENFKSIENNEVIIVINNKNKDNSSTKSLALQDHSKSKDLSKSKEIDSRMDFTLVCDKTINKEGMKRSKESSDDTMELTCESVLVKRKKKEKFRKTRSVGSLSSGRNFNNASVCSTDSFYDARSDGILSLRSNKWCLKPIKEVCEKPNFQLNWKEMEGLSFQSGFSYDLNLFSTFIVKGAIINILPSLSEENFGNLVEGFCNEGCRTKYKYEDFKEMEPLSVLCTFCRYNYHLACPGCSKSGSERPLCLYYNFEIHLFDGENVLRVEIDHKSGVDFLGCTPHHYLKSGTMYKKINKIIFSITQDKWVTPVILNAKIEVKPKSGASILTLEGTSLRKDLTFKGKHYKL